MHPSIHPFDDHVLLVRAPARFEELCNNGFSWHKTCLVILTSDMLTDLEKFRRHSESPSMFFSLCIWQEKQPARKHTTAMTRNAPTLPQGGAAYEDRFVLFLPSRLFFPESMLFLASAFSEDVFLFVPYGVFRPLREASPGSRFHASGSAR